MSDLEAIQSYMATTEQVGGTLWFMLLDVLRLESYPALSLPLPLAASVTVSIPHVVFNG